MKKRQYIFCVVMMTIFPAWAALAILIFAAPAAALDVWCNQAGFDTNGLKRFRVVDAEDHGGADAAFEVIDASGGTVLTGAATYQGSAWGSHFWLGDISSLTTPGHYFIRAGFDSSMADSYSFAVENDIVLRAVGKLLVHFFYIQRCGYTVPGWHAACHLDDGAAPDGGHMDVTGGWHDSGEYQKYTGFFHPWATHALLEAYERRPDFFETLDQIEANGIPDILEEAMWGIRFEAAMVLPDGHVYVMVKRVRGGTSWLIPEDDTDNASGTSDDRAVIDYEGEDPGPNSQALWVAGNLARLHRILSTRGGTPAPDPSWPTKAESIWTYYMAFGDGTLPYGDSRAVLVAAIELFKATDNPLYSTAADTTADALAQALIADPGLDDGDFVGGGKSAAALAVYLENFPDGASAGSSRTAVTEALDYTAGELVSNPVGLLMRDYYGERVYFVGAPRPPDGWFRLGQNGSYGYTAYAANLGASVTGEAGCLDIAADQMGWVMGGNPQRWCMIHGAGTANPLGYHHRYAYIEGHLDGAVPGAVLNGYARSPDALDVDAPWIDTDVNTEIDLIIYRDITVADYETNEPWLPNSAGVLLAVATLPFTPYIPVTPDDDMEIIDEPDDGRLPEQPGEDDAAADSSGHDGPDQDMGLDEDGGPQGGGCSCRIER